MSDLLHRIYTGNLAFDHADFMETPEYQALSAEEGKYFDELEAAMGFSFASKCMASWNAVSAYLSGQEFQQGARLGAQLMLELLKPL